LATASVDALKGRAKKISAPFGDRVAVVVSTAVPGAGSVPGATIPSVALRLSGSADSIWSTMAGMPVPVIATRRDGAVFVDLRSVLPYDDDAIASAISAALS
jgi:L-seryl-tRNA(Ser) seleniumtransferase